MPRQLRGGKRAGGSLHARDALVQGGLLALLVLVVGAALRRGEGAQQSGAATLFGSTAWPVTKLRQVDASTCNMSG